MVAWLFFFFFFFLTWPGWILLFGSGLAIRGSWLLGLFCYLFFWNAGVWGIVWKILHPLECISAFVLWKAQRGLCWVWADGISPRPVAS